MPQQEPVKFFRIKDASSARKNGKPFKCDDPWRPFVFVRLMCDPEQKTRAVMIDPKGGEFDIILRDIEIYPKIVVILEDHGPFQKFETYDTDPQRPVKKGTVALVCHSVPDACIDCALVSPTDKHLHDPQIAVAV